MLNINVDLSDNVGVKIEEDRVDIKLLCWFSYQAEEEMSHLTVGSERHLKYKGSQCST